MSADKKAITVDELRDHLFECADIIRDLVDPTDYKTYILPLIFYKAIDDTWQDRFQKAMEEVNDEELAKDEAYHDFQVPEKYHFEEALKQTKNVDEFLDDAFRALEKENPEKLGNVFNVSYVESDSLDHDTLQELLQHLNTKSLSLEKVAPDILGEAYMDLVSDFAEEEGKSGGQFFTPREIVNLMVQILNPQKEAKIYDPTVGSAGMLVEMAEHYRNKDNHNPKTDLILKGQESNPGIAPIARMNLFLHNLNGEIAREDTLANPQFTENGDLEKFDYVLANPPFSSNWKKDKCKDDEYNRFEWGWARKDRADYAFIQHMIASLKENGKMACVIPHGVLFRKHESKFRKPMLENDLVEAVIGLPKNLFQNNSIPSGILVINKEKPDERKGQVQFIHAAEEDYYKELSNQNRLTKEGIKEILKKYRNWKTEEKVSRVVELQEIKENDYNLNIALYIDTTKPEEPINVSKELKKLKKLQQERQKIEEKMKEHMETLNYE
ncbi:class I SAM-dependent DNA methyltransferase [Methanonatronarchaeum sp. AMET-Sl]|uniref:type I restriction-modification system subunit M n=1 Tax=Methanonatronarchaeum sp. AMET-Sl TaxID=3037654 RepID=UPI00244E0118|nr:class I SAM-dependent DNA methyltransferase [Methanonatronarchaeum sp. AMET-Sl]WGI17139.1 class I SAM-dependent DNA methyltransferase [Methanonatronarchaeum sp. AMET-Sl]